MFDSASPYLAYRCDIGVPAPSCCWFPHAVQSHCGHLVLSTQTSSHCRQIVGLPSPQAGGCHAPGSQSPLPAAGGAPGRSLPFTPAPSIIPHSPTQSLSRPRSLSGEQRDVFLLSVFMVLCPGPMSCLCWRMLCTVLGTRTSVKRSSQG